MIEITISDPLREVYLLDTPDGKHFCPKFLRGYRGPTSDINSFLSKRRIVKVDLVEFEDAAKTRKKLVVPIIHALQAGPNSIFVVYIILTPDPKAATGIITNQQYKKLPEMEIEGI